MNKAQKQILLPSLIVATLLIIAVFYIKEYSYYIFLRWIICLTAIYIGIYSYETKKIYWVWIMGLVVLIFNPIIPFHLGKDIWIIIDFITAIIFVITILIFREKKTKYTVKAKPAKRLGWQLFLWILLISVLLFMFYLARRI